MGVVIPVWSVRWGKEDNGNRSSTLPPAETSKDVIQNKRHPLKKQETTKKKKRQIPQPSETLHLARITLLSTGINSALPTVRYATDHNSHNTQAPLPSKHGHGTVAPHTAPGRPAADPRAALACSLPHNTTHGTGTKEKAVYTTAQLLQNS